VPVEAQAAGTPVVAPRVGGSVDTVSDGVSGILIEACTVQALAEAIGRARELDSKACIANAEKFSAERFRESLVRWTSSYMQ